MGMMKKPSASCYTPAAIAPPNPDPWHFEISEHETVGRHLVACITYPNCTTYEGRKVLVFANVTISQLRRCKRIDPHFCEVVPPDTYAPVARFEPTERGWHLARIAAAALQ